MQERTLNKNKKKQHTSTKQKQVINKTALSPSDVHNVATEIAASQDEVALAPDNYLIVSLILFWFLDKEYFSFGLTLHGRNDVAKIQNINLSSEK
ncbi:Hypothetical predicted protein [Octopus vulgaris]|uniref:Uncharacterized protein n=1 Tax=Octopus vulgaris TaxID=6645 RepID=A0AA36BPA1_OCTVU|nr:Hypothetical predicted protein [Octopus vulgaris]